MPKDILQTGMFSVKAWIRTCTVHRVFIFLLCFLREYSLPSPRQDTSQLPVPSAEIMREDYTIPNWPSHNLLSLKGSTPPCEHSDSWCGICVYPVLQEGAPWLQCSHSKPPYSYGIHGKLQTISTWDCEGGREKRKKKNLLAAPF